MTAHVRVALCAVSLAVIATFAGLARAQDLPPPEGNPPPPPGPDARVEPAGGDAVHAQGTQDPEQATEDEEGVDPEAGAHPTRAGDTAAETAAQEESTEAGPAGVTVAYAGPREPADRYRLLIPPLLVEREGQVRTTTFFPFFFERSAPDDEQLLAGLYYHRRGRQGNADALAPFWFNFWDDHGSSWIVPPVYNVSKRDGYDFGIAPLVFSGRSGSSSYLVIPPLLTASWRSSGSSVTSAGALYWRVRSDENVDWGVFPLIWSLDHVTYDDEVVAPFFFRFHDRDAQVTTTVIPPFHLHEFPGGAGWGLSPLIYGESSAHGNAITVPALLFHYSDNDHGGRHVITPLGLWLEDAGSTTLVTPLYERYRGATWLDATAPFFFAWGDPRERSGHWLVPPLFYREESPGAHHTVVLPFYAQFAERGRYDTWATLLAAHWESHTRNANATWVFPNVQVSNDEASSTVNIWPLMFHTEAPTWRHNIVAGLYWDFEHDDRHARETVVFPFVWRFASGADVQQVVLNTYYHHWRDHGVPGWEIHVFPFFAWGSNGPDDDWWTVLYGLAGYERHGTAGRGHAFWLPFDVSH